MRVTKAQAQANRAHIVETASRLFRERGYDGVGVADLMAAGRPKPIVPRPPEDSQEWGLLNSMIWVAHI